MMDMTKSKIEEMNKRIVEIESSIDSTETRKPRVPTFRKSISPNEP